MRLPSPVHVLLIGSGGRESAFAWKISQSPHLGKLYIATGNAGTGAYGINVDIHPKDFSVIKQFVLNNFINLVVVGPEEPLVRGISDYFREDHEIRHIPVIGPSAAAAKLEGSKDFAKAFMKRHGIPTADYLTVMASNIDEGERMLDRLAPPYVLKADGLAAGKGVLIIDDLGQAKQELRAMLDGKFGEASKRVVIEEFLSGVELSVFVATDGKSYKILPEAKDYKRIGEGDTGPNTGGMGAVSPVPFATGEFMDKVRRDIVEPTVRGIAEEELDYKGFIFLGLINCDGEPKVIEYNVRMGDPETEAVFPRITSDLIDLLDGIAHGTLESKEFSVTDRTAVGVVCVAGGYPGDYCKGDRITGLEDAQEEGAIVFHAGTTSEKGEVVTAGGRVLVVTSFGDSISEAAAGSYRAIDRIDYRGKYFRSDIGKDLL